MEWAIISACKNEECDDSDVSHILDLMGCKEKDVDDEYFSSRCDNILVAKVGWL
jgi:hypothetical protein